MAKVRGRDIGLYVARGTAPVKLGAASDYTLVGLLTSRSADNARNAIDASDADSVDDMDYLGGRRSRVVSMEGHYDATEEVGVAILKAAYDAAGTESVWFLLAPDELGDKLLYGRAVVTAVNLGGDDDAAATFSVSLAVVGAVSAVVAPGVPTGLMAPSTNVARISLSWTAPAPVTGATITNYRIRRRVGAGAFTSITRTGTSTTLVLTSATVYDFQVRAETANAASRWSAIVQGTPL